jgi:FG-GAP-like repeat
MSLSKGLPAVAVFCLLISCAISAQTFQPPVAYPTGALAPNGVAVGDLNNDGHLDVVVVNTDSPGTLAVLLGNGDGTLQPAVTYAAGDWPEFVVLADFNKDGKLDAAVANRAIGASGWVNIFLGNGDGTFQSPQTYGPFYDAFSLAVADFNRDGALDIAVADIASGSLLLGNGDGTFHLGNPIGASAPVFFAVADFNRDGKPDLASAYNTGSEVQVFLNGGLGKFILLDTFPVSTPPIALVARDFNGDGIPDIAVADEAVNNLGSNVTVFESTTSGYVAKKYPYGDEPRLILAADMNNDGKFDLVTENEFNGTVDVFVNGRKGVFRSPIVLADGSVTAASVAVGDLNGDGKLDIVVTDGLNDVHVLLQK